MLRKIIAVSLFALLLTPSLFAQSNFLERNNTAFSVFGGFLSSSNIKGVKVVGAGATFGESFDVDLAYLTSSQSEDMFSLDASYFIIQNNKAAQPFSLSAVVGISNSSSQTVSLFGATGACYLELSTISMAPSLTVAYVKSKSGSDFSYEAHFPLCLNPNNRTKFILEPAFSYIKNKVNTGGITFRVMFGGK